ncbi:winged helix-turn-helix transcriptional regulator [Nocardia testacea]|uniref:Winged helix-turn-helix transcriptional regulator n=1 Tax=Nocardia testacea TaxID=248551 RepID=A0ABW7VVP2_9NOCA
MKPAGTGRTAFRAAASSELRRAIPGLSQRLLTVDTRNLLRDRLFSRRVQPAAPPRSNTHWRPWARASRSWCTPSPTGPARSLDIPRSRAEFEPDAVEDFSSHRDLGATGAGYR